MTSEVELNEIRALLKLSNKVDGLNDLVEELIGYEDPTQEDVAAIKEYKVCEENWKDDF